MREEQSNAPRGANSGPMTRRALVKASLGLGFCAAIAPVWAQTITTPAEGPRRGRSQDRRRRRRDSRLSRPPERRRAVSRRAGGPRDFRRARAHQGRLPALRQARLLRHRARLVRAPGRRRPRSRTWRRSWPKSSPRRRTPSRERSRRDARLRRGERRGRPRRARRSPASAGAAAQVWLYAAHNPQPESRGRLVRPARLPGQRVDAEEPARRRRRAEGPHARALWRPGQEHPARPDRGDARQARRGRRRLAHRRLSDAGHAFYADYRPSYVKADAEASWKEATAWLKAHGV